MEIVRVSLKCLHHEVTCIYYVVPVKFQGYVLLYDNLRFWAPSFLSHADRIFPLGRYASTQRTFGLVRLNICHYNLHRRPIPSTKCVWSWKDCSNVLKSVCVCCILHISTATDVQITGRLLTIVSTSGGDKRVLWRVNIQRRLLHHDSNFGRPRMPVVVAKLKKKGNFVNLFYLRLKYIRSKFFWHFSFIYKCRVAVRYNKS